jgi:hypothetical protein
MAREKVNEADYLSLLFDVVDSPIDIASDLWRLNDERRLIQADTYDELLLRPLDWWREYRALTPSKFGYESWCNFRVFVWDLVQGLRNNKRLIYVEETSAELANSFRLLWKLFIADNAASRLYHDLPREIERENKENQRKSKEIAGAKTGGKRGKGKPKNKARYEVVKVFKKERGDRTVKQFLSDWVDSKQSFDDVECERSKHGYTFTTPEGDWSAKLGTVEAAASKKIKTVQLKIEE